MRIQAGVTCTMKSMLAFWILASAAHAWSPPPEPERLTAPLRISVEAGDHCREFPIVFFPWAVLTEPEWRFEVVDESTGQVLPSQRTLSGLMFRLPGALEPGDKHSCLIRQIEDAPKSGDSVLVSDDHGVLLSVDGQRIAQYNTAVIEPPGGIDPVFRRSGHIHPVWTPSGKIVTEEFPADHPHQHGVFHAWVNTTFNGRKVDFWNQADCSGTVSHVRMDGVNQGPVFCETTSILEHRVLEERKSPVAALEEALTLRAFAIPGEPYHVLDVHTLQKPAGEIPLVIAKYHYGGFAVRGAAEWFQQPESDFLTSEGKTRKNGNHSRPRWVNLHGLVAGQKCGITVIDHPGNPRFPQPVRLHPDKPYFVYSPPVIGSFSIHAGNHYEARYRLVIHDGEPDAGLFDRLAEDFVQPLTAKVDTPAP